MTNTLTLERLEELENRNKVLENKIDTIYENNHCLSWLQYKDIVKPLQDELDNNKNLIRAIKNFNVKVGDGITLCYYSDREAYTIIRRRKCISMFLFSGRTRKNQRQSNESTRKNRILWKMGKM